MHLKPRNKIEQALVALNDGFGNDSDDDLIRRYRKRQEEKKNQKQVEKTSER